jgi:hypothetical protein
MVAGDHEIGSLPHPKTSFEDRELTLKIRQLGYTRYVFVQNHRDLTAALAYLLDPINTAKLLPDHERLEMYHVEVIRLLHNYLASAKTLIDHTRILARDLYEVTTFWEEYEARVTRTFADSRLANFVQRLRNYMLHKELPFTSATMLLATGADFDCYVNLDLARLRAWDGWNAKAREYLDVLPGDQVRLDQLVGDYTALVGEFHDWLEVRQKQLHYGC